MTWDPWDPAKSGYYCVMTSISSDSKGYWDVWDDWHNLLLSHPSTGHLKSKKEDNDVSKLQYHTLIFQYSHGNSMFWKYLSLSPSISIGSLICTVELHRLSIMNHSTWQKLYKYTHMRTHTDSHAKGLWSLDSFLLHNSVHTINKFC